ncbi:MAG: hypothetical protein WBI40_04255 [Methylococcaceae bacterium]
MPNFSQIIAALLNKTVKATVPATVGFTTHFFETNETIVIEAVHAGGTLTAETVGSYGGGSDTRLDLYDANGVSIATNDDFNGTQSKIVQNVAAGTYYIVLSKFDSTTPVAFFYDDGSYVDNPNLVHFWDSQASLTTTGVDGLPTMPTGGVDIFAINVIAGNEYTVSVTPMEGETPTEVVDTTLFVTRADLLGDYFVDLWETTTFIAEADETLYLGGYAFGDYAAGKYTVALTVVDNSTPVTPPAPTVDALIQDALNAVKTYVDTQDASVKAHAEALIAQLMNTSDLTAKLALLNQINDILDGDAATAGFQAWQSSLARLTSIEASIEANKSTASGDLLAAFSALKAKAVVTFAV